VKKGMNEIYDEKVRARFVLLMIIVGVFTITGYIYGVPFWLCFVFLCLCGILSVSLAFKIYMKGEIK
jgi:hypothetical protein